MSTHPEVPEAEAPAAGHPDPGRPVRERLDMLGEAGCGLGTHELLGLGLTQAVSSLRGLGGMLHLGYVRSGGLLLTVDSGLPRSLTQPWKVVGSHEQVPPARAARGNTRVWVPADGMTGARGRIWALPPGTGLAAVPVPSPEGDPQGALSVITTTPLEPDEEEWAALEAAAGWTRRRLAEVRTGPGGGTTPSGWKQAEESWEDDARKAARIGAWDWDLRTEEIVWDEAALEIVGIRPEDFEGRLENWMAAVHPEDLQQVLAETEEAILTRRAYSVEYRVRRPKGTYRWVEARGHILTGEDGRPTRVLGTVRDTTESRTSRDWGVQALSHMSDGFLAVDGAWRIAYLNTEAERLLGSSRRHLGSVLWDAVPGLVESGLEAACRRAVADGAPTGVEARWPGTGRWYHLRLVPVPDGLTVHMTDVTDAHRRNAEQAAAKRAAARRSSGVTRLTGALAAAGTVHDVVTAFSRHALPLFGGTGLIVMVEERNRLWVAGATGYPDAFCERLNGLPMPGTEPIAETFHTGEPVFLASPEEFLRRYPTREDLAFGGGKRAWALLPLIASGRTIGCCALSFDEPHAFDPEERDLLTALSGLVSQALERARQYDAEHARIKDLQRGLLPRELPALPAITAAARYLPSTQGMEVGGDWYDVIPLSGDRVALVIGDVMGHGMAEAATMGRLRTAVHTLTDLELPPDEILTRLNTLVRDIGDDIYSTCLYAVYDPADGTCVLARAGHPPPAIVYPDGSVRFPDRALNPLLGAAAPPFDTEVIHLPAGSLLALYTDGLVESSARDIDTGLSHLVRTLTTSAPEGTGKDAGGLEELCDAVVGALLPADQHTSDDAALLVARTHLLDPDDVACWPLPTDPQAAGEARDRVRHQLAHWGLDDLAMTTELLVSELIGNAVRHAGGPIGLRMLRSRSLICEVSDGSLTTPRMRRAAETDEGGRGLQLVAALSRRWGTRYTATGKSIWVEQDVGH